MLDGVVIVAAELLDMVLTGILSRDRERAVYSTLRLVDGEARGLVLGERVEGGAVVSRRRVQLGAVELTGVTVVGDSRDVTDPALTAHLPEGTAVLLIRIDGGTVEWAVPADRVRPIRRWLNARK